MRNTKKYNNSKPSETEIERALLILSTDPEKIAGDIRQLDTVAGFQLSFANVAEFTDYYWDTPSRQFDSRKLALRIREMPEEKTKIALKGPPESTPSAASERLEIEREWSERSVREIVSAIKQRGISLAALPRMNPNDAPTAWLKALGLEIVQERHTKRVAREIHRNEATTEKPLAELAVDNVEYVFSPDQRVRLHEIEIEAKSAGETAIQVVSAYLLGKFGNALREWAYSKIKTGKAIEAILKDGVPGGFLDSRNNLTPSAIQKIEARLKNE